MWIAWSATLGNKAIQKEDEVKERGNSKEEAEEMRGKEEGREGIRVRD